MRSRFYPHRRRTHAVPFVSIEIREAIRDIPRAEDPATFPALVEELTATIGAQQQGGQSTVMVLFERRRKDVRARS